MKLKDRLDKYWKTAKRFYALYTSGLNRQEIEHLLKRDAVGALEYYIRKTDLEEADLARLAPRSIPAVIKDIFISFVMQLTPARRLFYGLGMICFVLGLLKMSYVYLIGSFLAINGLLALELADKLTTRDELEIARDIQLSLQPEKIPKFQMLSIASYYQPAKVVGGDFFDIVQLESGQVLGVVGDVSGKGMSAALYAAYFQSMFHSMSENSTTLSGLMKGLNGTISKRLRDGHFITAVAAAFDINEKSVTIARAGHNWPLYYSAEAGTVTELKPKGVSLGLFDNDQFASILEEEKIFLKPGDLLLFYSDGITEAVAPNQAMFDVSRLKWTVRECAHQSSEAIVSRINARLYEFVKGDVLQDDATILAIKIE